MPQILVPIQSRVVGKDAKGHPTFTTIIGETPYRAPDRESGGFHVCIVKSDDLSLVKNASFATGSSVGQYEMAALLDKYTKPGAEDVLVIVSSMEQPWLSGKGMPPISDPLVALGASTLLTIPLEDFAYSLIGRTNAGTGNGFELSSRTQGRSIDANITGYLLRATGSRYVFVYPEYLPFRTNVKLDVVDGITEIAGTFYRPSYQPGTPGGLHACVYRRDDLKLLLNETFETGRDPSAQMAMATALRPFARDDRAMVIVSCFGSTPVKSGEATGSLAAALESFGGTATAIRNVGRGATYSLVGRGNLGKGGGVEASSYATPDSTSSIRGLLHKDTQGSYEAAVYSVEGGRPDAVVNYDLYPIVYQAPTAWPCTKDSGEVKAYQYISQQGTGGLSRHIRAEYPDLTATLDVYYTNVHGLAYPPDASYSQTTFDAVKQQVELELQYAIAVRNLFACIGDLTEVKQFAQKMGLNTVLQNLKLKPEKTKKDADMTWFKVLRTVVMVAASVDPDPVSKAVLGVGSAGLYLGMAVASSAAQRSVTESTYPVREVESKIDQAFLAALTANGANEEAILSDWTKLQYVGERIGKDPGHQNGWNWTPDTVPTFIDGVQPGFREAFYKMLMPVKWNILKFEDVDFTSPRKYCYWNYKDGAGYNFKPYDKAPEAAYWSQPAEKEKHYNVYLLLSDDSSEGDPRYPKDDLTKDLFGSLHVQKHLFFQSIGGWSIPQIKADTKKMKDHPCQ